MVMGRLCEAMVCAGVREGVGARTGGGEKVEGVDSDAERTQGGIQRVGSGSKGSERERERNEGAEKEEDNPSLCVCVSLPPHLSAKGVKGVASRAYLQLLLQVSQRPFQTMPERDLLTRRT